MHTNYRELGRRNAGLVVSGVSTLMNYLVCAIHCHKVCTLVCPSRMMCCTCAWSNQAVASLQEVHRASYSTRQTPHNECGDHCCNSTVYHLQLHTSY